MAKFDVYPNPSSSAVTTPYLLDVQSDLIAELGTRVVVPLYTATAMKGRTLKTLTPTFEIDDQQYVMVTPQLAGIAKKQLGTQVADLSAQRNEIIAALDLLITGI